jgi:hypothetical protein
MLSGRLFAVEVANCSKRADWGDMKGWWMLMPDMSLRMDDWVLLVYRCLR